MLTQPVGQLAVIEPARREVQHDLLLRIRGGIDFAAVEDQESLHGGMPDAFVAIDERVALNQGQTERCGLLSESGMQVTTTKRRLGLGDCRLQRPEVPDARRSACRLQEAPMQLDDLPQRDVARQARRRYSSWFFCRTRLAAASNSSSRAASRSTTAARAKSSGLRPRRSASWRRRSPSADDNSMVTFMGVLYRVAGPSNNMVEQTGPGGPAAHHARWADNGPGAMVTLAGRAQFRSGRSREEG